MILTFSNTTLTFKKIPLLFHQRNIDNPFYSKNNKTLGETFKHKRYAQLSKKHSEKYKLHHNSYLGDFLKILKAELDTTYLEFLNKHGDNSFCEFTITDNLFDKGIYCFIVNDHIKYIGRCTDNFKKRVNQGYGKIHAKNCFIDGQSTNCHINSLINSHHKVEFGIYVMSNQSKSEIKELEKLILINNTFDWNVQTQ